MVESGGYEVLVFHATGIGGKTARSANRAQPTSTQQLQQRRKLTRQRTATHPHSAPGHPIQCRQRADNPRPKSRRFPWIVPLHIHRFAPVGETLRMSPLPSLCEPALAERTPTAVIFGISAPYSVPCCHNLPHNEMKLPETTWEISNAICGGCQCHCECKWASDLGV